MTELEKIIKELETNYKDYLLDKVESCYVKEVESSYKDMIKRLKSAIEK